MTVPETAPIGGATPEDEPEALLQNLMLFGEVLRRMGLNFGSANMLDLVRATEDVPVGHKQDFRHTARCLLVHRKPDLPLFDEAFQVFWRRPSAEQTTRDLRSMGEQRRYRAPQVRPAPIDEEGPAEDRESSDDEAAQPAVDLTRTFSAREVLRAKDFAYYTTHEMEQARQMMAELAWDLGRRRSRRRIPGPGSQVDLRRTFRRNLKHGGELLELAHRQIKTKPRSLVLICDVSGSMERYTRMLLHFIHTVSGHSVAGELGQVEAFLFATRLTRITRQLNHRSIDEAVTQVSRAVPDWAGGTRIGETLRSFNFQWSRRIPVSKGVVLIISDGWDRGEPELLSREMARLQRSCRRLIWLNPLLGSPTFEPLTQGLQAALPYVDNFLPVHNIDSLQALAHHLNDLEPRQQLPSFRLHAGIPEIVAVNPESQGAAKPGREINPALASTFRHPLWGQRRT